MDEDERVRDREETKRLLYVALTRARDRLYLGSVLKDGAFAIGRGSLGDVLPESLRALFVRAGRDPEPGIDWTAGSGTRYSFTVCRAASPAVEPSRQGDAVGEAETKAVTNRTDRFEHATDSAAIDRV